HRNLCIVAAIALSMAGALLGCSPARRPFMIAQVCLQDVGEQGDFRSQLRSIAQSQGAVFKDDSKSIEEDLRVLNTSNTQATLKKGPVIYISIDRGHGVGMTATNVGGPQNQVVMGFSEGSKPDEAHKFAELVIGKLKERWRIEFVPKPSESGALGMKD